MPKNILFLHTGAELYGSDKILFLLVTNLDKKQFRPIVVLPNNGPLANLLKKSGIETHIIPYPIIRREYFSPMGIIKYLKEYINATKNLCSFAKVKNIDIIHSNTVAVMEGFYIRRKLKIPTISHIHETISHPKIVAKLLYRIAVHNSDRVVVVSNFVKKYIEQLMSKKIGKIIVIHNGIPIIPVSDDEKQSCRERLLKEFKLKKDAKIIAMVGRINGVKGQSQFIDMMKDIVPYEKNSFGLIIGDAFRGQEWRVEDLKQQIKVSGIGYNVFYCGFRNDMSELYKGIDCLVLPSVDYDSFPTVVLEAFSNEVPVVAYKNGGVIEMIIDGKNGYLVEMGDYRELSKRVLNILEDKNNKMGRRAYAIVKKDFCLEKFIEKFQKLYEVL